ncbi:hypothetical protein CRG98_019913 [Punica granatum]|uniref:DUF7745 domain-containing protein n=1 Tax=Punica granatum TaxID=22663 RepID=A0A2I0JTU0_PUNGR|nr:hypothetical protein CRG98_019913 [Punica granatum]
MPTRDIVVPNQFATIQSRLAILLSLRDEEIRRELQYGWEHSVRTAWLIDFIHVRALSATRKSYQCDACHGFLLLIFGTILFSYSSNLIDEALAQVILQVVGGHSYVEVVLAETIRSLDYIWLLAHITPFCLSHPFSHVIDERSLIASLLQVFQPFDHDYTDWKQFMEGLTLAQFLWAAHWNPSDPMAIGCPSVIGLPLISHLGSTLILPGRVIRQLGSLQDIPTEADRTPHRFMWANTTTSLSDSICGAVPSTGFTPIRRLCAAQISWAPHADIPEVESSAQGAMRTELQFIREERDRLRRELVETCSELTDQRELQAELTQARTRITSQDREITRLSATLDRARAKAHKISHP